MEATAAPTMMDVDQPIAQVTTFPALKVVESTDAQYRKVVIPAHRLTPLRAAWLKIYTPLVEHLKLQVRFNTKARAVEMRTSEWTVESGALQKASDFVRAFTLGYDVDVRSLIYVTVLLIHGRMRWCC